jgi:hypothetical protein
MHHGNTFCYRQGTISREDMMNDHNAPLTISVPEAGERYFGLCRNAAYNAAARGEIPTIRIGRLLRVPVRALERILDRPYQREPA